MKRLLYFLTSTSILLTILACNEAKTVKKDDLTEKQSYTCPMHPQIVKNEMSTCPICAMDLVLVEKSGDKALKLDTQRQLLANISTLSYGRILGDVNGTKVINGTLLVNPMQNNVVSAKFAGRIEKLFVREVGEVIKKGQALFEIYSEELASLQQEYLMALAQQKQFPEAKIEQQLVASTKQKLLLYGQSEVQIKQLEKHSIKKPTITVYAVASGTVTNVFVNQGQYINAGAAVFSLAAYDQLWVEGNLYADEASLIKIGDKLKLTVVGWEREPVYTTVSFINPVLQSGTQMMQFRGEIHNPNNKWQAGLQVQLFIPQSEQIKSENFIPVDAVITDAKGSHVWVKTSKENFEPRAVVIGKADEQNVQILEGLIDGDEVVVTGAYLLYSEYVLKRGKHPLS